MHSSSNTLNPDKYLDREDLKKVEQYFEAKMLMDKKYGRTRWVRNFYFICFLIYTGARISEVCHIKIKDLSLSSKIPSIYIERGKGNKNRTVYIPSKLKLKVIEFLEHKNILGDSLDQDSYLFSSPRGVHLSPRYIQMVIKKMRADLGLKRCTPHTFRHTYATMLYQQEKDLRLVMKMLGHSNIKTTTIYADVIPEEARLQIEKVW
jgi:integrase/recombinase XerD